MSARKGKYILLDFWGSWCAPCIQGIPALKEYHDRYKDKVEFVSIACLDIPKKWKATVKKYDLQWTQLFNDTNPERNTCIKYGINAFPTKILVDPDGNIVSIHSGESKAFYEEMDRRSAVKHRFPLSPTGLLVGEEHQQRRLRMELTVAGSLFFCVATLYNKILTLKKGCTVPEHVDPARKVVQQKISIEKRLYSSEAYRPCLKSCTTRNQH